MSEHDDYERNNAAYQRLKETVDRTYPKGQFVGIGDDQIVGDAGTFRDLERLLQDRGRDPRHVLVVEAGITYPEHVTIFI
jgi:hypothetical protein